MASAEPGGRFELSWQAPASCPTREVVVREIDELVAGSSLVVPTMKIDAYAAIATEPGGFSLALSVRDAEGLRERKLEAPSCEELGHAAALIVALAIDPRLLATHSDPGGTLPSTGGQGPTQINEPSVHADRAPEVSPPTAAKTTATPSVSVSGEAPTKPLGFRLGLIEFVGYRTLPGTNLGTGVFGAIQMRSVRLEVMLSGLLAESKATHKQGAGATFALYRSAAKGCWLFTKSKWATGPCVGIELGLLRGRGYGVDLPNDPRGLWFASTLGALFEVRLTQGSVLGVAADAEMPWVRDKFELSNASMFEPRLAARFGASLAAGW